MKKVSKLLVFSLLVFGLMVPSFSLLKVDGNFTTYTKSSGVGFGIDFPLIPFFPTSLYYASLGDTAAPSFTYGGVTFTAGDSFKQSILELQVKLPISLAGIEVAGSVVANLAVGSDGTNDIALPGNIYSGVSAIYKQSLLPFVDAYVQAGYLTTVVSGEKEIEDANGGTNIDLSNLDQSGLYYRFGVTIGL